MIAKFNSSCIACGEKIVAGKQIAKNEQGQWVHKHCTQESEQLL